MATSFYLQWIRLLQQQRQLLLRTMGFEVISENSDRFVVPMVLVYERAVPTEMSSDLSLLVEICSVFVHPGDSWWLFEVHPSMYWIELMLPTQVYLQLNVVSMFHHLNGRLGFRATFYLLRPHR